jgi:phage tail sheath gpL-like
VSIVATNQSPTPVDEFAAAVAAVAAFYGNADPARPFQTLALTGVLAPAEGDRFTLQERNLLLFDGISTTKTVAGGVVQLGRLITTYQTSASGASDISYLDVTTMLTLAYLRYSFRNRILQRYPRHKLADDGTRFGAGQAIITPKIGKAEAVAWFSAMETLGLVENIEQFKTDLIVERNVQDPNRLDFLLPPDLVNQFIVGAAQIQFRL